MSQNEHDGQINQKFVGLKDTIFTLVFSLTLD